MNRTVLLSVGVYLLVLAAGGMYLVQFGFMGYQPHVDGDGNVDLHEEYEYADEDGSYTIEWGVDDAESSKPPYVLEQTVGDECLDDDTAIGGGVPGSTIEHLNEGAGADEKMEYEVTYAGTAVVENSDQEVFVRKLTYDPDEENGELLLAIRDSPSDSPARDCKLEVEYVVTLNVYHRPPSLTLAFVPEVFPNDAESEIELGGIDDDDDGDRERVRNAGERAFSFDVRAKLAD